MKVRWVDLSRYGAMLQILPKTPLRPVTLAVLTVRDVKALENVWFKDPDEDPSAVRERFKQALAGLGFDYDARRPLPYDDRTGQVPIQCVSRRTQYSLADLRTLGPGLEAEDMRQMDPEAFVIQPEPADEALEAWTMYLHAQAEADASTVWIPKAQPFAAAYDDSPCITSPEILPNEIHPVLNRARLVSWQVINALDDHYVRGHAVTLCYATKSQALAAGYAEDDLQETRLPYALPLRVREDAGILALADVRHAPEAMMVAPDSATDGPLSDVLATLRRMDAVREVLQAEAQKWQAWGEAPDTLRETAEVHRSLQTISDAAWSVVRLWRPAQNTLRDIVEDGALVAARKAARLPETLPVKALHTITPTDLWELASLFYDYGALREDTLPLATFEGWIATTFDRVRERLSEEARAAAKEELHRTTTSLVSEAARDEAQTARHKHEDAGEHIGGARKDFARRAMTLEDFEAMNELEREGLVQKKNIWPPLNYKAMRERGVSADAAYAIKMLKDALPVRPSLRGRCSPRGGQPLDGAAQRQRFYIETVTKVRDRLSRVKTVAELSQALAELYAYGVDGDLQSRWIYGGTLKQVQWGSKFCALLHSAWNYGDTPRLPYDIHRDLRRKVGDDPNNWSAMIKPKQERSDAAKAEAKAKADADKELHRPHLAHVCREGEDWRQGKDVTADDLMEHFGFRAVEFGNWLPQDERQDVLNMTFDSFADLAMALDLPPKAMSFDGSLALAFGSRGTGGRSAALAHYEPSRCVINLTRMKGAGCLAHEWTHGWDFHLGKGTSFIENAPRGHWIEKLARVMMSSPPDIEALHDRCWDDAVRGRDNVYSWLYLQPKEERPHLREVNNALFDRVRGQFESALDVGIKNYCAGKTYAPRSAISVSDISYATEKVMAKLKAACSVKPGFTKVKQNIEQNLLFAFDKLATVVTIEAAEKAGLALPEAFLREHAQPSDFKQQAKKLDEMRSKPYWATPREMLARACAAYVSDELERRGCRNDYLVYGVDEQRHINNPYGNPNPAGRERDALATAFGQVWEAYRLDYLTTHEAGLTATVG